MSEVNWYGEEIKLIVKGATRKILDELALVGEGLAKINIAANNQIDTGFMLNSVYSVGSNGVNNEPAEEQIMRDKTGEWVLRQRGNVVSSVPDDEAVIACAASYAIYQEMRQSFLYAALEKLQSDGQGVIERIGAEELGG